MSYPSPLYNIIPNPDPERSITSSVRSDSPQDSSKMQQKPKSTRRSVACKSCHTLKVKCIPVDINNPGGSCVRCMNANRECEIDLNQTRKRRKKGKNESQNGSQTPLNADETIAKLQEQVRMLQAQIQDQNIKNRSNNSVMNTPDFQSPPFVSRSDLEKEVITLCESSDSKLTDLTNTLSVTANERVRLLKRDNFVDCVSRGLIDIEEAQERLNLYHKEIYTSHPLIEVPEDLSADEIRKSQPILFNSIMSVSNALVARKGEETDSFIQEKALRLDNQAIISISEEILAVGTKSEELIKSLLLLCLWYNAPELFRNRRYHLLNSLAVSLLHDIGIGGKPSYSFRKNSGFISQDNTENHNLEYRSLVMVLYVSTVSIFLILRRSIYVKWTPYVEDCCQMLQNSGALQYQRMALFLRLSHELDRIHHIIHSPDVNDKRSAPSYYMIRDFQKRLSGIKGAINPDNNAFLAYYYSVEAYLHEPILSDIFSKEPLENKEYTLTELAVKSISRCTNSCLNALDEFNKLDSMRIAKLPLVYSSRIIYTIGMLLRLRYLVLSLPFETEKDLVPRHTIFAIQKLARLVDSASSVYRVNHFLMKTRLIVQLFIQTYATQIKELLKADGDNETDFKFPAVSKHEYSQLVKLNKLFNEDTRQNKLDTNKPYSLLAMDIMSYPNTYKNGIKANPPSSTSQGLQTTGNSHIDGVQPEQPEQPEQLPINATYERNITGFGNRGSNTVDVNPLPVPYNIHNNDNIINNQSNQPNKDTVHNNQVHPIINNRSLDPSFQPYLAKPDQLENSYLALNDEFWTDLFNTNSHPINFSNTNTVSDYNDEVFFMN